MTRAAFFDVDDTLITVKSIFRFLEFHLGGRPGEYRRAMDALAAMRADGLPREAVNRAYYRLWSGASAAEVAAEGERWFAAELASGGLLHRPVAEELHGHRAQGHFIVLVTGSFPACVEPLARHVGADLVLSSEPVVADGRYTGEVVPMIGAAKERAVRDAAHRHGLDLARSAAYGDHASDLSMLRLVGSPVVVGDDTELLDYARFHGWPVLPGPYPKSDVFRLENVA